MSVKQYLNNNSCRQVLLAFFVFILAFVSIVSTIDDYGLTWDEPHYIVHSERISEWLGKLIKFDDPFSDETFQKYWNYDRHHNCHPPFYKLSGVFFRNLVGSLFFHTIILFLHPKTSIANNSDRTTSHHNAISLLQLLGDTSSRIIGSKFRPKNFDSAIQNYLIRLLRLHCISRLVCFVLNHENSIT